MKKQLEDQDMLAKKADYAAVYSSDHEITPGDTLYMVSLNELFPVEVVYSRDETTGRYTLADKRRVIYASDVALGSTTDLARAIALTTPGHAYVVTKTFGEATIARYYLKADNLIYWVKRTRHTLKWAYVRAKIRFDYEVKVARIRISYLVQPNKQD